MSHTGQSSLAANTTILLLHREETSKYPFDNGERTMMVLIAVAKLYDEENTMEDRRERDKAHLWVTKSELTELIRST